MVMSEADLLTQFRETRSEAAFAALVSRYTNLVYSIAIRRLSSKAFAKDAMQTVFIRLANTVPKLRNEAELAAWLHRTTVHICIDIWRTESRRQAREERSISMQPDTTEDATWSEIAPVLDDALNELSDGERQVILLRFFEQKSMRDLGVAFGIGEDAAKMRVSRATERLRSLFRARGVTCGVAALGTLLTERSVEAAPQAIAVTMEALQVPAADAGRFIAGISKSKMIIGAGVAAIVTALTLFLVLMNQAKPSSSAGNSSQGTTLSSNEPTDSALFQDEATTNGTIDPLKLLQDVARARNRITSGEVAFEISSYHSDYPLDGTNIAMVNMVFEGTKRRFETLDRQYAYTVLGSEAAEVVRSRIEREKMDKETAVREGLLKPFESREVMVYDGTLLMEYAESDGKQRGARIRDASEVGSGVFDPRCLGIAISPGPRDTIESCLLSHDEGSVKYLGEDVVDGLPAFHILFISHSRKSEFWLDIANPLRVLKHTWNGGSAISKYNSANLREPIPTEVVHVSLHGGQEGKLATLTRGIRRGQTRFGVPVDPVSWTLAGLGMKVGTSVDDSRVSRRIGYWTGSGLSESFPRNDAKAEETPNREDLLATLKRESASTNGFAAARWIILNTPDSQEVQLAADTIKQEHITSTNLLDVVRAALRMRHFSSIEMLEQAAELNPSMEIRGHAAFTLATLFKEKSEHGKNKEETAKAMKWFSHVIAHHGILPHEGRSLAELSKPELLELQQLKVGDRAPGTEGQDLEGNPLSLDNYRGKIVLLIFWNSFNIQYMEPRPFLKYFESFPEDRFAIIGVCTDNEINSAKEAGTKWGITWRSFHDGEKGPIARLWNHQGANSFTIIDAKGTIRHRNVQTHPVRLLEQLLAE
jgi:RNA polymerase sigma factor (sigma-70 family)